MTTSTTPTYSIVTTCKGRLDDLKQSLPRFVAQDDAEVIVVDYDCPQGTAAFVRSEYPDVKVITVSDRPMFNMPDARNRGAAEATGRVLAFIDADIVIAADFLQSARFPADGRAFAAFPAEVGNSLRGTCLIRREDFDAVGGYDDLLTGYESEDLDMYMRLRLRGVRQVPLDAGRVEAVLEQPLEEKLRYRPKIDIRQQFLRGQLYQLAKESVIRARSNVQLDRATRERIMAQVDRQVGPLFRGERPFEVTINLPDPYKRGLLSEWEFSTAVTVRAHKKPVK